MRVSPYQKSFYIEWQLNPERYDYNIVLDQEIKGNLDVERLNQAICNFSYNHFIFNSHIVKDENNNLFWQHSNRLIHLDYFPVKLKNWQILDYVKRPFNLETGPLFRSALIQLAPQHYRFIVVIHHIIMDGLSGDETFQSLSNYYNDNNYHARHTLSEQQHLLANLADQMEQQQQKNETNYKEFWQQKLAHLERLDLLFLRGSYQSDTNSLNKNPIGEIRFAFDQSVVDKVNRIKRKYQITPYLYSKAIYALLLYKLSGQKKFAVSYPIAIKEGIGLIYGAHVNLNFIPFDFGLTETVTDFLMFIKNFVKELKQGEINHSYYPTEKIITASGKQIGGVSFAATNFKQYAFRFNDCQTTRIHSVFNIDQVDDLSLLFSIETNKLDFIAKYKISAVDKVLLEQFIVMYKNLYINILDKLLDDSLSTISIKSLQLLSAEQYQQIVIDWNKTETNYPQDKTIHQLFEEQAAKTPDNIAVVYEDKQLTYRVLNQKSNQLAHYLRTNYQIKADDLIALCLDRSQYMLIAILGVLKSGGAYVPLDPAYPEERINYILEDTKAKVLICDSTFVLPGLLVNMEESSSDSKPFHSGGELYRPDVGRNLSELHSSEVVNPSKCHSGEGRDPCSNILAIDSPEFMQILSKHPIFNPNINISSSNLAYVIYTSGTTGKPKGVKIKHESVLNTILSIKDLYSPNKKNRVSFFTSYVFDVSVSEIFTTLMNGYELHILSEEVRKNADLISNYLLLNKINVCYLPPVLLSSIKRQSYPDLVNLIYAGEPCDYETGRYWSEHKNLYNYYGPTETAIYCLGKQVINGDVNLIGRPLNNTRAYILDNNLQAIPIGAIGDLYIGGSGLAIGYLNLPGLTRERFIANPFQSEEEKKQNKNNRLYKTGDLVRYLADGNIEYIGRNDFQVKIRGFRIELDEIEVKLSCYPDVKQAVVLAKERITANNNGDKYLVGYYVAETKLDEEAIFKHLAQELPDYMVPSVLVYLEKLPLTINGKLDRKALPDPEFNPTDNYVAPRNELEKNVCQAYEGVLGIETSKIGINDDFFKLGGNSILAIKLTTQLQHNFKININDIFALKTPAKIAATATLLVNNFSSNLEQIKLIYANLPKPDSMTVNKQILYKKESKRILFNQKLKNINNVLLTGSTGFLGCNILYQLLDQTKYKIYLLVRAFSDKKAYQRLHQKFNYYFDINLDKYRDRLVVMNADLAKSQLNLTDNKYQNLIENIDSIIHCAALVKHYGNQEEFYLANAQSTINLLELARLTKWKDFHYISTKSVFAEGYVPGHNYYAFTEEDSSDVLKNKSNLYLLTKYEGERITVKYREYGVATNIYRVGSLVMHSKNYKIQQNIEDNGFYQKVSALLNLKMIPPELSETEISPVDSTALSIVKLFNQVELSNQVYHVFNPHVSDIRKLLTSFQNIQLSHVGMSEFVDTIRNYLESGKGIKQLELFLLHQGWLQEININNLTKIEILSDKTTFILNQLGFSWPKIKSKMLSGLIQNLHKLGITTNVHYT